MPWDQKHQMQGKLQKQKWKGGKLGCDLCSQGQRQTRQMAIAEELG